MATFLEHKEICDLRKDSETEANIWREDYQEYERLADNELIADLDESLPEVNDGSLAAALFKLPKRVVNSKTLKGRATALDAEDAWITELANIQWEKKIVPNANSQAPFIRKWKDAVRKAAIYGGVPIISLFVERGDYTGADFIVAHPNDVYLEPGKVSDYDSDIIWWDVYYSKLQVRKLIERAENEAKEGDGYSKWDVKELKLALETNADDTRESFNEPNQRQKNGNNQKGIKFSIAFQRGVEAPFYMYRKGSEKPVREWTNPDPTGDIPVHYLYCYQDFVNPYGVGIVKLAGGTQNTLDFFNQIDILATLLGVQSPLSFSGDTSETDFDSFVYAANAQWMAGNATVKREEMSNQVYQALPQRIEMHQSRLNKLIPMGTSTVSSGAGDPMQSKTPAGVKQAEASLSIDDEDFKDNLYITYEAVAQSMINIEFANMQGSDLLKLSDEERDILGKAGLEFPVDETGTPTNELELIWDETRAKFKFEMEAEEDKATDDEKRLEALKATADFVKDPTTQQLVATGQPMMLGNKKLDPGELVSEIVNLATDSDKVLTDVTPEDQAAMEEQQMAEQAAMAQEQMPVEGEVVEPMEAMPEEQPVMPEQMEPADDLSLIMDSFQVDEPIAQFILAAEAQGASMDEIREYIYRNTGQMIEVPEVDNV